MIILLVLYLAGLLPTMFLSGFYVGDEYVRPTKPIVAFWFCVAFAWPIVLPWGFAEHYWETRGRRLWRAWRSRA